MEGASAREDAGGTQKWGELWKEVLNVGSAGTMPEEGDRLFLLTEHRAPGLGPDRQVSRSSSPPTLLERFIVNPRAAVLSPGCTLEPPEEL